MCRLAFASALAVERVKSIRMLISRISCNTLHYTDGFLRYRSVWGCVIMRFRETT
jgi:hypothetical protein